MVQLELFHFVLQLNHDITFNSIMVQLEQSTTIGFDLRRIFQFHYGSIRTLFAPLLRFLGLFFQFHYGSIRTLPLLLLLLALPSFNSIMVQLELYRCKILAARRFFQFHYGSIRTYGQRNSNRIC